MIAEVISIGDELTSGQRLDTNSQWLSERLGELGVRVIYHTTVADDLAANVGVFRTAAERADLVVVSGGLGPTADDLTREALATMAGRTLIESGEALAHIEALFARRQRPMPERNKVQALFPDGARVVPNPHGTAPGIDLSLPRAERNACRIFCLPGVPAEMREMWEQTVRPALEQMTGGGRVILHKEIKCFGVGESDLEAMLPDIIRRGRDPQVGITVHQATITLRISAAGSTARQCSEKIDATEAVIRECLGNLVYGENGAELQHVVIGLLAEKNLTLATVEQGTGGLVASWLSEAPRGDGVFLGGRVVRHSAPLSLEDLAAELRDEFGANYVLATGPFPPLGEKPAGDFVVGVLGPHGWEQRTAPFGGHPDILRQRAAKQALNWLRLHLLHKAK